MEVSETRFWANHLGCLLLPSSGHQQMTNEITEEEIEVKMMKRRKNRKSPWNEIICRVVRSEEDQEVCKLISKELISWCREVLVDFIICKNTHLDFVSLLLEELAVGDGVDDEIDPFDVWFELDLYKDLLLKVSGGICSSQSIKQLLIISFSIWIKIWN